MDAFGRSGSNVGKGVEYGVGVGAEFASVADEAGGEVGRQGIQSLLPGRFVVGRGSWEAKHGFEGESGLGGGHVDAADGGEELGELVPHLG